METIRIAVIGAGYWGPNLIRVFSNLSRADLVAVCDLDEKKLSSLKSSYPNTRFTTDSDQIFDDASVDAVVLALPVSSHHAFASRALESGKHCFVEKPLATTTAECQELVSLAAERDRKLMVGHVFEYNAAVRLVKDEIDSGNVGQIFNIFSQRLNLGQVRSDVDVIWNLAPHDLSIALYWMGGQLPTWVSAQGFSFLQEGVSDIGSITMQFPDGAVAQVMVSWLSPDKIRQVYVTGSEKMIIYDDVSPDAKVKIYDKGVDIERSNLKSWSAHTGFGEFQMRLRSGDVHVPRVDSVEPLRTECEHFIDCIVNDQTPISDGESGLRVARLLELAEISIKKNGERIPVSPL